MCADDGNSERTEKGWRERSARINVNSASGVLVRTRRVAWLPGPVWQPHRRRGGDPRRARVNVAVRRASATYSIPNLRQNSGYARFHPLVFEAGRVGEVSRGG